MARACRWTCPPWHVTFDPSDVLLWAWQEVKIETVSVNESDYLCSNLLAAGPRGKRRGRGVGFVFEGCIAPPIKEMRLDVAWAVLFCGLVEFVSSVAMWVLCSMGCGLPVAN